jgi:hypothetical protein
MTVFGSVILFFQDMGVYDVVLPFLLVFTIVYALLEKTKVLGTEKFGDKDLPKRNINSMAAFVIAFFVVASAQLVAIINEVAGNVVLLLLLITFFMLLVGTMERDSKEGFHLTGGFKTAFMWIMFLGVILIFLNAFGWLDELWVYLVFNWDSSFVGMILLLAGIIGLMAYVMHTPKEEHAKEH